MGVLDKTYNTLINKTLLFLISISVFSKLLLVRGGFLTEPDERLYFWSFSFIKRLSLGHIGSALESLFSARGRPVEVLLKSIPATLQIISAKIFGLNVFETKNMWIIFGFNMIIFIAILFFIYKIALLVFKNKSLALITTLFYSLLINSFVYLRHIYPYDTSLLLTVLLLYYIIKLYISNEKISQKKAFSFGFLAFLSFMFYPTFYLMFYVLFFVFVWVLWNGFRDKKYLLSRAIAYISGSVFLLVLTELTARAVNKSYILNLLHLSGTIDQGDYNESVYFLFKYLINVEYFTGILIIIGLLLFIVRLPKLIKTENKVKLLMAYLFVFSTLMYLLHTGILCYWTHKMTVYIRQMHQFMPVLVLFAMMGFNEFYKSFKNDYPFSIKTYKLLIFSILVIVLIVFQMKDYLRISYPRDVYWTYLRHTKKDLIKEISEYDDSWSNLPTRFIDKEKITNTKDTIIAVNTQYFFPVKDFLKYHPYKNTRKKLIFSAPHFLNYKAYQYEGYTSKERENINKMKLFIRIYKILSIKSDKSK